MLYQNVGEGEGNKMRGRKRGKIEGSYPEDSAEFACSASIKSVPSSTHITPKGSKKGTDSEQHEDGKTHVTWHPVELSFHRKMHLKYW